jgi:hypothetical protein
MGEIGARSPASRRAVRRKAGWQNPTATPPGPAIAVHPLGDPAEADSGGAVAVGIISPSIDEGALP